MLCCPLILLLVALVAGACSVRRFPGDVRVVLVTRTRRRAQAPVEMDLHFTIGRQFMSKTLVALGVVMALSLGSTGCGEKTPSEKVSDSAKSAGQAVDDAANATGKAVGDAAKAAGDAVGDAAEATGDAVDDATKATGESLTQSKDAAVKAAQETLSAIEKKWQDLQAKAAPATDEAKADLQKAKDQMAQTLADAKAKLVEAKDAGADAWEQNVKPAFRAALQRAQKLYEEASAKFSSK